MRMRTDRQMNRVSDNKIHERKRNGEKKCSKRDSQGERK